MDPRLEPWQGWKPEHIQVAAEGAWETSWRIQAHTPPTAAEIDAWFAGKPTDVSVEVFCTQDGDDYAYCGVNLSTLDSVGQRAFLARLTQRIANGEWSSLGEIATEWWPQAGMPGFGSTHRLPDTIELGVVNAWNSVGSYAIWQPGDPQVDQQRLADLLLARPDLRQPREKAYGVEAVYQYPWPHWFSTGVSREVAGEHQLDLHAVERATRAYTTL